MASELPEDLRERDASVNLAVLSDRQTVFPPTRAPAPDCL